MVMNEIQIVLAVEEADILPNSQQYILSAAGQQLSIVVGSGGLKAD